MKIRMAIFLTGLSCSFAALSADMTLESGDYRVVFSEKSERWSIVQIFCRQAELGTRTGYYGNVLAPQNGKYIGAGHTEGGTEELLTCALQVDGKSAEVGAHDYRGQKLVFTKTSMLANVKMSATYTLTAEELKIDKHFEAVAEQPVYSLYLYQFCWNAQSSDYLFGRLNGTTGTGRFVNDEKMRVYGESGAYYFSLYYPELKHGVISYLIDSSQVPGKNLLWDCARYHKYYFWIDLPTVLPAGYRSPETTMIVRGFSADTKEAWETAAQGLAEKLQKQYPFAPPPAEFRPLPETELTLPPSGKFQCRKIALPLEPASEYNIAFEIRKTPEMSVKPTDHYLAVGYYDAARNFKSIANFAAAIKADSEYHQVQGAFKTPPAREEISLYIYNSRSTGKLTIRNLEIKKTKLNQQ